MYTSGFKIFMQYKLLKIIILTKYLKCHLTLKYQPMIIWKNFLEHIKMLRTLTFSAQILCLLSYVFGKSQECQWWALDPHSLTKLGFNFRGQTHWSHSFTCMELCLGRRPKLNEWTLQFSSFFGQGSTMQPRLALNLVVVLTEPPECSDYRSADSLNALLILILLS